MDHVDRITAAEEQFAKEVALNVLYSKPPKIWQNMIPGMFIFDFLRRTGAIRRYTKKYMFPRQLAVIAVRDLSSDFSGESAVRRTRETIDAALQQLHIESPALARAYRQTVELLSEHYDRLMRAQGESYDKLVRLAYPSAGEFESHLQQLTAAENAIDTTAVEAFAEDESLGGQLQLEAEQVADRRRKVVERIYGPAG